MQPKYRNSNEGFRSFSRHRSRGDGGGGGFSRNYSKSFKNPKFSDRKMDILMEAGRLAAEYLVAKGMLPPDSLPAKSSDDSSNFNDFRGRGRDNNEGRSSAASRHGDSDWEAGYRKRRFDDDDDEYDRQEYLMDGRDRKRRGYYSRERSLDRDRERGRRSERSRGYSDRMEDEDDLAPSYRRRRQSGFDNVRSSVSRAAVDNKLKSKIESLRETGLDPNDNESKASSENSNKDAAPEADADFSKEMIDGKVVNVEAGEVKQGKSSDFGKKTMTLVEEDFSSTFVRNGDESATGNLSKSVKLCDFTEVPRSPGPPLAQKGLPVDKGLNATESNKVEGGEAEITTDTAHLEDLPTVEGCIATCEVASYKSGSVFSDTNDETTDQQSELSQDVKNPEPSMMTIDHEKGTGAKKPELLRKSSPAWAPQENELSQCGGTIPTETRLFARMPSQDAGISESGMVKDVPPLDVEMTKTGMVKEMSSQDLEMIEPVGLLKTHLAANDEAHSYATIQQERCNRSASFKTIDLNLIGAPEILDDTDIDHISASSLEPRNEPPECFGPSGCSKVKSTCEHDHCPSDDKLVAVIDLENDPPIMEAGAACETSKPKKEIVYTSVENVLNQATNEDDAQVMQDRYALSIPDSLGRDIPCSPSIQTDHRCQTGMGLPGPEVSTGVDDAIYGTLSDIGYVEVWEQPRHEYEKFL